MTLELQAKNYGLPQTAPCSGLLLKNKNIYLREFQFQKKISVLVPCIDSMFSVDNKHHFTTMKP